MARAMPRTHPAVAARLAGRPIVRNRPGPGRFLDDRVAGVSTATGIMVTVLALAVVGLVMIQSSSAVFALRSDRSIFYFVGRQGVWTLLGVGALVLGSRIPVARWRTLALPFLLVTVALLVLVLVPGIGRTVYGARRWLGTGHLSLQPSEIAKLAMAVFVADLLARRVNRLADWRAALRPVAAVSAGVLLLVMLQPDMGTSICILLVVAGITFASAIPIRHLLVFFGTVVVAGALLAWHEPYRRARLLAYRRPFEDSAGDGYQVAQSLVGLGNGGPTGVGLGQGRAKWGFLPNAHTDFIFSVLGEEAGLVGTFLVLGLFLVLAGFGVRAAARAPDRFGALLAAGITTWLVGQGALNIGTTIGLVPVTGVPLPFVSSGGSALVISLFAAGVLAAIAREGEREAPRPGRPILVVSPATRPRPRRPRP